MDSSVINRFFLIIFFFFSTANAIEFQGKFLQGHFILGKTNPDAKIIVGKKEVRAWEIKKGSLAPQAAGTIHTDFEKGFIRAETISYEDYIEFNGELGAKEAGKLRSEGSEYIIKDGDIVHFRFNV